MGYSIHIERQNGLGEPIPIPLAEWIDAVAQTEGVRLLDGDISARNPRTGELITIRNEGGDAEVFLPQEGEWVPIFFWSSRGHVNFNPGPGFEDPIDRTRTVAVKLAALLNGLLVGDEGETYP